MDGLSLIVAINAVFFISLFVFKNVFISLFLAIVSFFILINFVKPKTEQKKESAIKMPLAILKDRQYISVIVSLLLFIFLERFIGFNAAMFSGFFLFAFLNNLDSRAPFFMATILLALTAYLSISNNKKVAEDTAILVYYFLVIGTVWMTIELKKEERKEQIVDITTKTAFKNKPKIISNLLVFVLTAVLIASSILAYEKFIKPKTQNLKTSSQNSKIKASPTITPTTNKNTASTLSIKSKNKHSLLILNGTQINGLASSTSAQLKSLGWEEEFNISVGNAASDYQNSILKYTTNLKDKAKKLEKNLNLKLELNELKTSTVEGEIILILGKD